MGLLSKIFGTKFSRDIKKVNPLVEAINARTEELVALRDEEFRGLYENPGELELLGSAAEFAAEGKLKRWSLAFSARTNLLRAKLESEWEKAAEAGIEKEEYWAKAMNDEMLVEAYATVKAACFKLKELKAHWEVVDHDATWEMVPFDVQIIGGVYLHKGSIAEMATGEGKTLVATMPIYLNALTGRGVHLITVNDYLARRDAEWMGGLYNFLGLTVGIIQHDQRPPERRQCYASDITYGTNNEFGFDYLRDNGTAATPEHCVQRPHYFAIIDEVDSVLIDEARTPLIISGPAPVSTHRFDKLNPLVRNLAKKQQNQIARLLTEAERALKEETDQTDRLAARKLLLVKYGSPKNRRLMKVMEDPSLQRLVQEVDNELRMGKGISDFKEELFYTIEEKSFNTDLTEKGREALSPDNADRFIMPDVDAMLAEVDEVEDVTEAEREELRGKKIDEAAILTEEIQNIIQLVKAYTLYERDVEYVVKDNRVMIVDEFTGRLMAGRRFSDGLHQALEAKEGVKIERETITLATITLQNYFRLYEKLAGMTGTAETEASEFHDIYTLNVSVIPTNEPIRRIDHDDLIFKTKREKYQAVIEEIEEMRELGRPVLVGTVSVEVSEVLSRLLKRRKIPHNVLNAKQHQSEADIIRQAGHSSNVTIATNMAGRGTDIKLGSGVLWCLIDPTTNQLVPENEITEENVGRLESLCCIKCRRVDDQGNERSYDCATCPKLLAQCEPGVETAPEASYKMPCGLLINSASPPKDEATVKEFMKDGGLNTCGLHIIGTERHDARRIDRQLRGRAGRQGDPGSSRFYLSTEDNLMRLFGSDRIAMAMERANVPEGEPIFHPLITKMIGTAQKKVEDHHFSIRKNTLDYDDVVNRQREVIYTLRRRFLEGESLKEHILGLMIEACEVKADQYCPNDELPSHWDISSLRHWFMSHFPIGLKDEDLLKLAEEKGKEGLIQGLELALNKAYELRENSYTPEQMAILERWVLLSHLDKSWKEHITALQTIREGIGLRAYAQRDPLVEYKQEAFEAFSAMLDEINDAIVTRFFKYRLTDRASKDAQKQTRSFSNTKESGAKPQSKVKKVKRDDTGHKLGRNDPCPCGSGKKYKKCCWNKDHE